MAFTPIPQTAEVALRFLQDGQNVANVWHVIYEGDNTQTTMDTIASNTITTWQTNLRPLVASTVTLLEVSVVDQSVEGGVASLLAPANNNTGTVVSQQLPNGTTVSIKKSTGRAGRSFRGRIYHIGLCESQVDINRLTPAFLTSLNTAYTAFIAAYRSIQCEWAVASLFANNAPRTVGVATPILGVSTDPVIDSQRRRLPGRGR